MKVYLLTFGRRWQRQRVVEQRQNLLDGRAEHVVHAELVALFEES